MATDETEDRALAGKRRDARRRFTDFDCPDCSANNPWDEAFGDGDELRCHYCGLELLAVVSDGGRLRLKPI